MSSDSKNGANQWIKSNLAGLGSAAVLAVYAAGFERTRAAAAKFNEQAVRRPPSPARTTGEIGPTVPRVPPAPSVVAKPASPKPEVASAHSESTEVPARQQHAASAKPSAEPTPQAASAPAVTPSTEPAPTLPAPVHAAALPAAPSTPPAKDSATVKPVEAPPPPPPKSDSAPQKDLPRKDGTYTGWGTSRHGDIQATVQIKDGKIVFAAISECLTQYSCSWIAALPPQVLTRQSADVDIVSGATQSTNAFYYAVLEALNKAK